MRVHRRSLLAFESETVRGTAWEPAGSMRADHLFKPPRKEVPDA
jgi:hypothetical protein